MYKILTNKNSKNGDYLIYNFFSFKEALNLAQQIANEGFDVLIKKNNIDVASLFGVK